MKVLFIGGTGVISSACSALALSRGIELFHLNRGLHIRGQDLAGVQTLTADVRDIGAAEKVLGNHHFDAVVDWIAFETSHIRNALTLFGGRTDQYVFISSASVYQKPPQKLPVTEKTPADNPFWTYAQLKIACEDLLKEMGFKMGLPYTIVRPSHTYDKTKVPLIGGYTALQRIKKGMPVVVHGDGTSIWTLTHSRDFAPGLIGLLGKTESIGEIFHITSDEWLSWNNIYHLFAGAMGVEPHLVHVPSHVIAQYDKDTGDGLLGDKAHSMIFDNSKIRGLVPDFDPEIPFADGVQEIVRWYEVDRGEKELNHIHAFMESIILDYATG